KTQSVELYNNAIDTPGEYMENRNLYNALITTSADAKIIAIVYDATQEENYIAPGFASMFCKDVIGIITKNKI
ncbi:ethanolamine utilization protein EutP, partial [Clostridioides difficile]